MILKLVRDPTYPRIVDSTTFGIWDLYNGRLWYYEELHNVWAKFKEYVYDNSPAKGPRLPPK